MKKGIKSFYDWCLENNRRDLLDRWDYNLNKCNPKDVQYGSGKKYYFKCPQNLHKSELNDIHSITRKNSPSLVLCRVCNSIAYWGINHLEEHFLEKYWDYKKNINIDPWEITYRSNKKVWIKCQEKEYHDSYEVTAEKFAIQNNRCPYCVSKKIHPKDSFAQYHIDNTDKDFISKYWSNKNTLNPFNISISSNKNIFIKCQNTNYHDDYKTMPFMFTRGSRCPYCNGKAVHKNDSLGSKYPQICHIWSDKNKKSPYEYMAKSNKMVWLKCENGHDDYYMNINNAIRCEFNCPKCTKESKESNLQKKVFKYITNTLGYKLNHEYKCNIVPVNPKTKRLLPFDNEIEDLRLIIEVNGSQHYYESVYLGNWGKENWSPEERLHYQQLKDRYKRFIAHHKGYFYLEIPYWTERNESYKKLIDNKIQNILSHNSKEAV